MVTKIRLQQKGKKHQRFFALVVTEERSKQSGKTKEKVGYYNPIGEKALIVVKKDAILKWLENGAKMTATARSLISKTGTLLEWHLQKGVKNGKITNEKAKEKKDEWEKISSKKPKNYIYKVL